MTADTQQAGPALDATVGLSVMGLEGLVLQDGTWRHTLLRRDGKSYWHPRIPAYSTDRAAALAVVDRLATLGWWVTIQSPFSPETNEPLWLVTFTPHGKPRSADDPQWLADTLPLAICRAALAAMDQQP